MKKIFYYFCLLSSCCCFGGVTDLGKFCTEYLLIKNNLTKEQKDKFNQIISAGLNSKFLDYSNRKIKKENWSGLILKDCNFSYSILNNIGFKGAQLSETIFFNTTFFNVDFSVVDLRNVNFFKCSFVGCNFNNIDLSKTSFNGSTFEKIDFSDRVLKDVCFENCCFVLVDFRNSNLCSTVFKGSKFKGDARDCLRGALLEDGFKFDIEFLGVEWVKKYSEFIALAKRYEQQGDKLKADEFYKKAHGLNKVLGPLQLNLYKELNEYIIDPNDIETVNYQIFSGLDLAGINLENANLKKYDLSNIILANANLKNVNFDEVILNGTNLINADLYGANLKNVVIKRVFLSENVSISENDHPNHWFEKWDRGSNEEKKAFQKLLNAGVPFLSGISNEDLKQVSWKGLDLSYSNLENVNLEGIPLEDVRLFNAKLSLRNLKKLNLQGAYIGGLIIHNLTLPNPCEDDGLLEMYKVSRSESDKIILSDLLIARGIYLNGL